MLGVEVELMAADVRVDGADAAELAELLAFVSDWLGSGDAELLKASLPRLGRRRGYGRLTTTR